jgi:hypothetical protein
MSADLKSLHLPPPLERIFSVGVLERMTDLPKAIALTDLHLQEDGQFQATIPSEGGFAWGAA